MRKTGKWVGGSSPNSYFVVGFFVHVFKKFFLDRGVGGSCLANPLFSLFFKFF